MNDTTLIGQSEEPVAYEAKLESTENIEPSREAEVKKWLAKIASAKRKVEPKFEEMRESMNFAAGWQWAGQTKLHDDRYINNFTQRVVNQKVAALYARNPKAVTSRRKRMDFQLWDEDVDTMMQAIDQVQMSMQSGMMPPIDALALIQDYQQGREHQKLVDRICKTCDILYQYQVDSHKPEFKEQMKQLVRRAVICKVGYIKVTFCRDDVGYNNLSSVEQPNSIDARIARGKSIMDRIDSGELDLSSPEVDEMKSLLMSIGVSQHNNDDARLPERIEFDFPPATSIIPSEDCRSLKEFIAASFVAQEYRVKASLVRELFGKEVKGDTQLMPDGTAIPNQSTEELKDLPKDPIVLLYEVFDIRTRTRLFVCKGYNDYIVEPEALNPPLTGFWPLFALTLNDVEADDNTKASIFPPSDVDLIRNAQKEWNRTRDGLRSQRNANQPKYVTPSGTINEDDIEKIKNAEPNHVIQIQSAPPGTELDKLFKPIQVAAIDPAVYDTSPLEKDMLLSTGMQEANIGPAPKDVTATVGTIAEQSRLSGVSSNVDDLDGLLSRVAQAALELLLRGMSIEVVKYIVGPGAVWPTVDVENYINQIEIKIEAASSGRPNKALEVSNAQQLVPLLIQAGASPAAIVKFLVERLDDKLDFNDFFPLVPTTAGTATGGVSSGPQQQMLSPRQQQSGLQTQQVTTNPTQ